jgi:hypothetical protein
MILPILGLADYSQTAEFLKSWFAFVGPFAASIIGFYFHPAVKTPIE